MCSSSSFRPFYPSFNNVFQKEVPTQDGTNLASFTSMNYSSLTLYNGKPIPVQAWTGPESSRKLKFPDFQTSGTLGC